MKSFFYDAGQFIALCGLALLMVPWLIFFVWGIDRKTKHLIALGASLATGCDRGTRYCLAAARESGATDAELQEAMAVAVSVAATALTSLQTKKLERE